MNALSPAALALLLLAAPLAAEQHLADPTGNEGDPGVIEPADAPEAAGEVADTNECDPGLFADLLGKTGEEVAGMEFNVPHRVIGAGDPVTTDFLPERVNFVLDSNGTVAEITCG